MDTVKVTESEAQARQEWSTPWKFFRAVEKLLRTRFTLDVCASAENTKCAEFLARHDAALLAAWGVGQTCWCNPGFSNASPWFDKAIREAQCGNSTVILTHACTGARWFWERRNYVERLYLVTPRVNFDPPSGVKRTGNTRDSMLSVITPAVLVIPRERELKISIWKWCD